jgi:hypothetical protein
LDLASSRWLDLVQTLMDWTDQHCRSSHRLMRCRTLHAEMVASAALVEFNRSDFCKRTRSCSIISVPGSALTKRASGVSSGILVHQDYRAVLRRNELSAPDGHHPRNHRFCETAEGDPDGGLPFGAIACFDLTTEAADRARSRAATPCKPPPTANTDERFVRLMSRGHRRYCANISIFLVSLW